MRDKSILSAFLAAGLDVSPNARFYDGNAKERGEISSRNCPSHDTHNAKVRSIIFVNGQAIAHDIAISLKVLPTVASTISVIPGAIDQLLFRESYELAELYGDVKQGWVGREFSRRNIITGVTIRISAIVENTPMRNVPSERT